MVAEEAAASAQDMFDRLGAEQGRSPLTDDEKALIFNKLRGGMSYFYDLAHEAGSLAGQGDAIGALSLLGGEDKARELIGDDETDNLLQLIEQQINNETERPPLDTAGQE